MTDTDWVVRWAVARAMGVIGDPSTKNIITALAKALEDKDSRVCEAASFALEQMGPAANDAVPALGIAATTTGISSESCKVIDNVGAASQKLVLGSGWTVRWTAARALGVVGAENETALTPLMQAMKDEEWQVRGVAALALGQFQKQPSTEVITTLVDGLNDKEAGVRMASAIALGELGSSAGKVAIAGLQKTSADTEQRVRDAAAAAIQKITGGG
jgi:HEAT repeat protein